MTRHGGPRKSIHIDVTVDDAMFDDIEIARGRVPRATWVRMAIESQLAAAAANAEADSKKDGG